MKYVATKKFDEVGRENSHHGLDRSDYELLKEGKTVDCEPRQYLIDQGYLKVVEAKAKPKTESPKKTESEQ